MFSSRKKLADVESQRPLLSEEEDDLDTDNSVNLDLALTPEQSSNKWIAQLKQDIHTYLTSDEPGVPSRKWIRNIFIPSLLEAGVIVSSAYGSYHFMEDPEKDGMQSPFIPVSILLLMNFILRTPNITSRVLNDILRMFRSFLFSQMDIMSRHTLFHEGGHALTALSLFKDSNPKITIDPFYLGTGGGVTHYTFDGGLSEWGEKFGLDTSRLLVTANGTGVSVVEGYLSLIVAQLLPAKLSEVKTHLRLMVIMQLMGNLYYAISAYNGCEKGHDFCKLQEKGDIEPYAAALFMTGSLLLLQLTLSLSTRAMRYAKDKVVHCYTGNDVKMPEESEETAHEVEPEERKSRTCTLY